MCTEGFIRIYRFGTDGCSLHLVHRTPLGATIPSAVAEFQGRLLVGCGRSLRLMECGKKKMLRKCEYSGLPSIIVSIHAMGSRIYVGDAHESFHYMRHKRAENAFYVFADDSTPRCAPAAAVWLQVPFVVTLGFSAQRRKQHRGVATGTCRARCTWTTTRWRAPTSLATCSSRACPPTSRCRSRTTRRAASSRRWPEGRSTRRTTRWSPSSTSTSATSS